ncbi:MAG: T9SS type A sorting domain-containing protein, partial [Bacteroidota bacterium]
FGEGYTDQFAMKVSQSGETLWAKTMGTTGFDHATAIDLGMNNEVIIGGLSNGTGGGGLDNVATIFDQEGVMKYAQAYGGDEKEVTYDMRSCSDGGYVLSGYSRSYGEGFSTAYVVRVNVHGSSECIQYYSNEFVSNDIAFEEANVSIEIRDTEVIYDDYELPLISPTLPINEKVCQDPYQLFTEGQQFNLDETDDFQMPDVGIRNLSKNVYPNPTTTDCFVDLKSTEDKEVQLLLFNVQGVEKWSSTQFLEAGWDYKVAIPMTGLRKGVYFLEILSVSGKITERIVLD